MMAKSPTTTTTRSSTSSSKRRISRPPLKKKNSPRQRRTNKPSPATILLDQWDMTPGSSTNNNKNTTTTTNTTNQEVQRKRFQERQKVFCNAIVEYRNIWFKKKKKPDDDNNNVATHWKHAMQFQHPITTISTTTTTIQQRLMESEPIFVRICSLCHELFVTTALLAESDSLSSSSGHQKQQQESMDFLTSVLPFWETMRKERTLLVERYYNHSSLSTNDDDEDTTVGVAPRVESAVQSSTTTNNNGPNWVKWIKSMVLRGATNAPPTTIHSIPQQQQEQSPLTAHQDLQYAPNHYHYNKLIGRLYFSYPPLLALLLQQQQEQQQQHDSKQLLEVLEQRALCIQRIFDQIPQNGGNTTAPTAVLTDKTVRLLIRSYQDIGTLEAAYQTEQVYHQYPTHRKGLLWYVLMSYLQVTQRYSTTTTTTSSSSGGGAGGNTSSSSSQAGLPPAPIHRTKFSPKSASLATKRICELLSKQQQQQVVIAGQQQQQQQRNGTTTTTTTMKMMMNPNEFQSCSTIGFQSLANITVDSLDHYYERVHALAVLKFGSHTWETLVSSNNNNNNNKHNLQLRSKDVASLHLLVQIYAKMKDNNNENNDDDDEYLKKAKTLFQNMWTIFSINELKESMPRTTFHSILEAMDKKKQQQRSKARGRRRQEEENTPDQDDDDDYEFEYALGLFDKMMTNKVWYPNAETFNVIFRLAEWGHQADQVLTRLELCRWIQQQQQGEYPISLLTASKHALRAWVHTAKHTNQQQQQQNDGNAAMERAYSIFQNLQVSSRPLLYQTNPEKVSHIYDVKNAPTLICYSLVWEACWHIGKNSSDKKTRQRAVEIATNLYQHATKEQQQQQQQDNVLGSFGANSYRLFLQCLSLSDDEEQRLALVRDVFETVASHDSNNKTSIMNSTELLEALLDCLCNDVSSSFSSSSSSQLEQQRRLELIQDIYNVVVSTHEMPIMSDRFLTLLGRLHPQLHDRYLAEHKQGKNELVKEGK